MIINFGILLPIISYKCGLYPRAKEHSWRAKKGYSDIPAYHCFASFQRKLAKKGDIYLAHFLLSVSMDLLSYQKLLIIRWPQTKIKKTESSKAKENVNTHLEKLDMNLKDHQVFQPGYLLDKILKIDLAHLRADGSEQSFCHCCSVAKLCPTPCNSMTAAHQASLSFTISWSLLKLTSIESVRPFNHLIPI